MKWEKTGRRDIGMIDDTYDWGSSGSSPVITQQKTGESVTDIVTHSPPQDLGQEPQVSSQETKTAAKPKPWSYTIADIPYLKNNPPGRRNWVLKTDVGEDEFYVFAPIGISFEEFKAQHNGTVGKLENLVANAKILAGIGDIDGVDQNLQSLNALFSKYGMTYTSSMAKPLMTLTISTYVQAEDFDMGKVREYAGKYGIKI